MPQGTLEDLRKVIALSEVPDEHLKWIYERAEYVEFEDGSLIIKTGEAIDYMILTVEGKAAFYMDVNGKLVYYFSFENDKQTGGAGGLLPYSRMKTTPGNAYAVGKVRGFRLNKKYYKELEQMNPDLIQRLIGYMTERARHFATQKLQYEKVTALGQLAAGVAHELNNPASAIDRISSELIKRIKRNYGLTEKLLKHNIRVEHIQRIQSMVEAKENESANSNKLSALRKIEREDEITTWLEQNGLLGNHIVGETFADSGFSSNDLATIRGDVGKEAFVHVLHWLENLLSSQKVIKDLGIASGRISNLVTAIKSHVHMDKTSDMQPTNIHKDLENTITLLGYKLRDKNITVKKNFCNDMRDIPVYVGELNQVWTNLIDNAIFAVSKNGEIRIETACNQSEVTVRIIDNGTGIPPEIISRIFDPFFTTKKIGEGTGIGLDLVMRIVKRHNGEIKVISNPGHTEFVVCLPANQYSKEKIQSA